MKHCKYKIIDALKNKQHNETSKIKAQNLNKKKIP